MNIDPKEKLGAEMLFVLQELKEENLLSGDVFLLDKVWPFLSYREYIGRLPSHPSFMRILKMLKKMGAIGMDERHAKGEVSFPDGKPIQVTEITIIHPQFERVYEQYAGTPKEGVGLALISYNPITGIGSVGERKFKFKDNQPEFRIFKTLYNRINESMSRYDVLVAAHFYEDGEDVSAARKTSETAIINDIAKKLRKITGLDTGQLVLNNGNLTLVGRKI